jgi:hypothetical protein
VRRERVDQQCFNHANKSRDRKSAINNQSQITDQKSKMLFMDWAGRCSGPPESGYRFWFRLPPWL